MDSDDIILCLHVDNIFTFENSLEVILKVKDYLLKTLTLKILGPADIILGMKISMDPKGISLSLSHNIEKMLHKFDFFKCKHVSTPYDTLFALKKNMGESISQLKYSNS